MCCQQGLRLTHSPSSPAFMLTTVADSEMSQLQCVDPNKCCYPCNYLHFCLVRCLLCCEASDQKS
jgi:hypothetical protein